MPEVSSYNFTLSEITKILLKEQKITEGVWLVGFEFGMGAGLVPAPGSGSVDPVDVVPASITAVQRVQLARFIGSGPKPSFAVDASTLK